MRDVMCHQRGVLVGLRHDHFDREVSEQRIGLRVERPKAVARAGAVPIVEIGPGPLVRWMRRTQRDLARRHLETGTVRERRDPTPEEHPVGILQGKTPMRGGEPGRVSEQRRCPTQDECDQPSGPGIAGEQVDGGEQPQHQRHRAGEGGRGQQDTGAGGHGDGRARAA